MIVSMSEARLNDLVYLTLKHFYFQPAYNSNPRECDIRVVMNMVEPKTWPEGRDRLGAMFLLPTEVAPSSHSKSYAVDTDRVFDEALDYIEDHWLKATIEEASNDPGIRASLKAHYDNSIVPAIMRTPEADCGRPAQAATT